MCRRKLSIKWNPLALDTAFRQRSGITSSELFGLQLIPKMKPENILLNQLIWGNCIWGNKAQRVPHVRISCKIFNYSLRKIPKFHLISLCENFMETRKLCIAITSNRVIPKHNQKGLYFYLCCSRLKLNYNDIESLSLVIREEIWHSIK